MVAKKKTSRNGKRRRQQVPLPLGLDANARAYAELLRDPCNAPLTHPVYSGGDGGYLGRYEVDLLTNNTGTGAFLFAPGCMGISADATVSSSGNNSVMHLVQNSDSLAPANDVVACKWVCLAPGLQPGYTALYSQSAAVRPVAACMQVFYPGSELNRSGVVSLARVNAGQVLGDTGNGPNVAQYRAISNFVARTPENHYEIKWTPADGDQLYTDPSLITGPREVERKSGLLLTYAGLPASATGSVRIRLVVVYEWAPGAIGGGMLANTSSRNRSANTLDHVLNALDRLGNWWTNMGPTVGRVAYGAYKAYQVLGGNPASRLAITM